MKSSVFSVKMICLHFFRSSTLTRAALGSPAERAALGGGGRNIYPPPPRIFRTNRRSETREAANERSQRVDPRAYLKFFSKGQRSGQGQVKVEKLEMEHRVGLSAAETSILEAASTNLGKILTNDAGRCGRSISPILSTGQGQGQVMTGHHMKELCKNGATHVFGPILHVEFDYDIQFAIWSQGKVKKGSKRVQNFEFQKSKF